MSTAPLCSILNCNRGGKLRRGWCAAHYHKWWRYGHPLGGGTPIGEPRRFFEDKAIFCRGAECLDWPFGVNQKGYGVISINGKRKTVSRLLCQHAHGEPPSPKHEAAHSCGNRKCVNPNHLRWATSLENHADELIHGTRARGERNGHAKLKELEVLSIRVLLKTLSVTEIADCFGVSPTTINDIRSRRTWAWL